LFWGFLLDRVRVFRCGGVVLECGDVSFLVDPWGDCSRRFDAVFVSHAHLDHVSGLKKILDRCSCPVFLSRESFRILRETNLFPSKDFDARFVSAGEDVEVSGVNVSFFNSGHVVGGLMFLFDFGGVSIGYTGDFNFEDSVVFDRADVLGSDVLILDTTYGYPRYSFPPRSVLYKEIRELLNEIRDSDKIPILHGFSLGKGQELTKLADMFLEGPIGVDKRVGFYNRVYETATGRRLGNYVIGGGGSAIVKGMRRMKYRDGRFVHVVFTGWAMGNSFNAAIGVPLSSHTGFVKLLEYIIESEPKKVYTLFGFEKFFANFVKKDLGIDASPLPTMPEEVNFWRTKDVSGKKFFSLENYF